MTNSERYELPFNVNGFKEHGERIECDLDAAYQEAAHEQAVRQRAEHLAVEAKDKAFTQSITFHLAQSALQPASAQGDVEAIAALSRTYNVR